MRPKASTACQGFCLCLSSAVFGECPAFDHHLVPAQARTRLQAVCNSFGRAPLVG